MFLRKGQSHRVSVDEKWSYGDGLRQAALYTGLALKMGVYLSSDLSSALLLLSRETTVKKYGKDSYTCLVQQPNEISHKNKNCTTNCATASYIQCSNQRDWIFLFFTFQFISFKV